MKKRMFLPILLGVLGMLAVLAAAEGTNEPWGNNKKNILAAQRISVAEGIDEMAVLSCGNKVLVGIKVLDGADSVAIEKFARRIAEDCFPGVDICCVGVGGEWAEDVIELPFYIDSGMNRKTLAKRFEYLVRTKSEKAHY